MFLKFEKNFSVKRNLALFNKAKFRVDKGFRLDKYINIKTVCHEIVSEGVNDKYIH